MKHRVSTYNYVHRSWWLWKVITIWENCELMAFLSLVPYHHHDSEVLKCFTSRLIFKRIIFTYKQESLRCERKQKWDVFMKKFKFVWPLLTSVAPAVLVHRKASSFASSNWSYQSIFKFKNVAQIFSYTFVLCVDSTSNYVTVITLINIC